MNNIEKYKPMIIKMACLLSEEFADDLIEVGMTKLYLIAPKFDKTKRVKFSTFFYKHVIGAMQDELRRLYWFNKKQLKEFKLCYLDDIDEEIFKEDTEELILSREKSGILRDAMNDLSDREKRIIILKYWNGMTNFEIACHLKLSESSISQTHKKALKVLKTTLVKDGNIKRENT